jgi:hypothetical protein
MDRRTLITATLAGVIATPLLAAAQTGPGPGMPPHKWIRERMYGSTLLSLDERQDHQRKMWNAKTEADRVQLRTEHRKMVDERARARQTKITDQLDDAFFVPSLAP